MTKLARPATSAALAMRSHSRWTICLSGSCFASCVFNVSISTATSIFTSSEGASLSVIRSFSWFNCWNRPSADVDHVPVAQGDDVLARRLNVDASVSIAWLKLGLAFDLLYIPGR